MALATTTIANSIAALSVTGVTIRDLDEMQNEVLDRHCPLVMPAPNYISKVRLVRQSFGSGTDCKWDAHYTLTYRLFHSAVGTGRTLLDNYPGLVDKSMKFVDAVITNDCITGVIDSVMGDILGFGVVTGPADNQFFGCDIEFNILEFVN